MLELYNIKKDYAAGGGVVHALKGVDLKFRRNEFVSILGPSGCGKTTMLNIIGGLDGYTEGDLVINGRSTKEYKDRDWDTYRNHSIGFVFQTYNLIPHQTVLGNVELALTLSGVSKNERRKRAIDALVAVGLGDQINKRPCAMSGGQMQRVAIARALVNNPDIILADEPTGALDTETSVQVMEILKEVAKDRLVIMVTHNPELAGRYSTRIIRMLDGQIIGDTMPLTAEEYNRELELDNAAKKKETVPSEKTGAKKVKKERKPSMSFPTAFMLSLKNLFSKKGRTLLTSFAGSIGIIGIALILAVSQGTSAYISYVQESTLSSYPLTLESTNVDISSLITSIMSVGEGGEEHENDAIYKDPVISELVKALYGIDANENDLSAFKAYLEDELAKENSPLRNAVMGIQYEYSISPVVYTKNPDGKIVKSDTGELMTKMLAAFMVKMASGGADTGSGLTENLTSSSGSPMMSMLTSGTAMWQELLPGLEKGDSINNMIEEQYECIFGSWPNSYDEVVLIVNKDNELDDLTLYALGLIPEDEIDAIIDEAVDALLKGEEGSKPEYSEDRRDRWTYEEVCGMTFKTIIPSKFYTKSGNIYHDLSDNETILNALYESATELRITGIIRAKETTDTPMLKGSIGYTHELTEYVIEQSKSTDVVLAQLESRDYDVLTGLPFKSSAENMTDEEKQAKFLDYVTTLSKEKKAEIFVQIQCIDIENDPDMYAAAYNGTLRMFGISENTTAEQLKAIVSFAISSSTGASTEAINKYLDGITKDQLMEMIRPTVEEMTSLLIKIQVLQNFGADIQPGLTVDLDLLSSQIDAEIAKLAPTLAPMLDTSVNGYTTEKCALYYEDDRITEFSKSTYEDNLELLGYINLDDPSSINIFATSFENKDVITQAISDYNSSVSDAQKISYTDYMGILMSSVTQIIDAVTYVLIAFVAISLIVSSIMIGVITLISVQERTKEIGILRAIGASKFNVSSMFNAETMIIGFTSGMIGVLFTYLVCIPINLILYALTGIANLQAFLPIGGAVALVLISMGLTLISGIIPSRSAAKKDPVIALRSE